MGSQAFSIRRSQAADFAAVLALLSGAGLPTDDLGSAPGLHLWVLEAAEELCGVIGMERVGADGLLRSLAITSAYRRRGLGRQLVARLECEAQANGVVRLVLLTETAEAFFRGLGYEVIERRSVPEGLRQHAEFRSLCPESAVCMAKALASVQTPVTHG
jgi:amino-acid N-acetyltransferase